MCIQQILRQRARKEGGREERKKGERKEKSETYQLIINLIVTSDPVKYNSLLVLNGAASPLSEGHS